MLLRTLIVGLIAFSAPLGAQVTFSANTTAGCSPLGVVISVTSPSASSISSYIWTITRPDGSIHTATSPQYVAILSLPGSYDVSLTINANQNHTVPGFITVHANPTASFTVNDSSGCLPHAVTLNSTSIPGSGAIMHWNWDFGNGSTATGPITTHTYAQIGSYTPVLSITDVNGCFATAAVPGMIQVLNTLPTAQFTATPSLTCPAPAEVSFLNTSAGNGPMTSEWVFGSAGSALQTGTGTISHTFPSAGTEEVCLQVTDAHGCQSQTCHDITILDQANPQFTANLTSVCSGSPVSFTNLTTPVAAQYAWDFDGNGTIDSSSSSPHFSYPAPGTYVPTLTATYSTQCSASFSGPVITVLPGISVSFSANQTTSCEVPFSVILTSTTSGAGITSSWSVNGVPVGSGSPFTHTISDFGNYSVTLTSTNASGCSAQSTQSNLVSIQPPSVTFEHPSFSCAGEAIEITDITVVSNSPVISWGWDFTGDLVADITGPNPAWTYPATGTYALTVFAETQSGCTLSWTSPDPLTVISPALPTFTASTTVSCAGLPIEFCLPQSSENQYSWNFHDGNGWVTMEAGALCLQHDYQDTGYFDLTLSVFNQACSAELFLEEYIYITPPVAIFDYATDCSNLMTVGFSDLSIEADQLIWDFGDGSPVVHDDLTPTHTFPGPGSYDVTLTAVHDALGCPDETVVTLDLYPPDAGMSFTLTSACPPALVTIDTDAQSQEWHLTISNGDSVHVEWNVPQQEWQVAYTQHGVTALTAAPEGQEFWPNLTFEEEGCYDILVATTDAFGCTAEAHYPQVVCADSGTDFADFTWTILEECAALEIQFEPALADLESWTWEFGNGEGSFAETPVHSFLPPYPYGDSLEVTLTAVDAGGCVSTVTHPIYVDFPIIPSFTVSDPFACALDVITFTNTTPIEAAAWSWSFGDSGSANSSGNHHASHSYTHSGTYEVCLTATNDSGCARTTCVPAAVNVVTPEAGFSFSSTFNSCLYGVTFTNTSLGSYDDLFWDFGDGQSGAGEVAYHTYPLGVYDVTLIASNAYGCSDTLIVQDIFNFSGTIGPFSQELDDANCAPFDVVLTAYNPTDTYFSYFWDFNDGYGDPSGSTTSAHTYPDAGVYCPQLIMTDPNGCQVLIECAAPIAVEEFNLHYTLNDTICAGEDVVISIANGTGHSWGAGTPVAAGSNPGTFILMPSMTETYTLTGYYSDCVSVHSIPVVVNPLPNVSLIMPDSYCDGQPVAALDGGSPAGPGGSYTINGLPAIALDPGAGPGNYAVGYHYTDEQGCSGNAMHDVSVHALPSITFTAPGPICENAPPAILTTGMPAGGTYLSGGSPISFFDPSVGMGEYPIAYLYTDSTGCSNSITSPVIVHPAPDAHVQILPTCMDLPLAIENNSTILTGSIVSTTWTIGGATYTGPDPQDVYLGAYGSSSFQVSMTSNHGCTTAESGLFYVAAVPVASFSYTVSCENTPVPFVSTSTIPEGSIASWEWSVGDIPAGSGPSIFHTYNDNDGAQMSLLVTSNHGCDTEVTQDVLIRPVPDLAISHGLACEGTEIVFFGTAELDYGGVTSYGWQFGDGTIEMGAQADHLYASAGTYDISLTATTNLGCSATLSDQLEVYPLPAAAFLADVSETCGNEPFSLLDLSSVDAPSEITAYAWYMDDVPVSTEPSPTLLAPGPGLYAIRLVVTTDAGCTGLTYEPAVIQVYPVPSAGFGLEQNQASMSNPVAEIVDQSSDDVVNWHYDLGDGHAASFASGQHEYAAWGDYTITQVVTNGFGCSDTSTRRFNIQEEALVYIPNAFTPDGNGHNEGFRPVISGFDPTSYSMIIFDRWGQEVYRTTDLNGYWNGLYQNKGEPSPDGSYTWQLEFRAEPESPIRQMSGFVILLR
ncbi:MAG: PKD domain-containing protein [Flavobacteriales bacterium]